jgi:hypothetical protein
MRLHNCTLRCRDILPTKALHGLVFEQFIGREKVLDLAREVWWNILPRLHVGVSRVINGHA